MNIQLTEWHEEATCHWCEHQRECVTTNFHDGKLQPLPLCWNCLQKAVKMRGRQASERPPTAPPNCKRDATREPAPNTGH